MSSTAEGCRKGSGHLLVISVDSLTRRSLGRSYRVAPYDAKTGKVDAGGVYNGRGITLTVGAQGGLRTVSGTTRGCGC